MPRIPNPINKEKQDNTQHYRVKENLKYNGSLEGRHPIHMPEIGLTVYAKRKEDEQRIREKYMGEHIKLQKVLKELEQREQERTTQNTEQEEQDDE